MARNEAAGQSRDGGKPRFCVIDKDAGVRSALCSPLRSIGLEVHSFEDAAGFLLCDLPRQCEGVIAEWKMKSMTGSELLDAFGAAAVPLAVIFTVDGDEEARSVGGMPGVTAVLLKPVREHDLLRAVVCSLTRST